MKSAIDGTVVRVNSKVGQFADKVEDDKPMFSIENLEELELEIKVSEYSIGRVKAGQKAVITADILDGASVEGEVVKISPTGEEKGGGPRSGSYPPPSGLTGTKAALLPGLQPRRSFSYGRPRMSFACRPQRYLRKRTALISRWWTICVLSGFLWMWEWTGMWRFR